MGETRLDGMWLVRTSGAGEWRTVADRSLDDSDWLATEHPGRWWRSEPLADARAVLYRKSFEPPAMCGERLWLTASGLCELGHLWLDGAYLGDLRGRHLEHAFEVTDQLRAGTGEHLLAAEASHGDSPARPDENAEVLIAATGPARIERSRVLVLRANEQRAALRISAVIDSSGTHQATISTIIRREGQAEFVSETSTERVLARGRNELDWQAHLDQPELWWPAPMGRQPLYEVEVAVRIGGQSSHSVQRLTGIRTVAVRHGRLEVNGQAHPGQSSDWREAPTPIEYGLASTRTYNKADRQGALLAQQLTLDPRVFAGVERGLRALAVRAAQAAADHAGHHPSIVVWQPQRAAPSSLSPPGAGTWANRRIRVAMVTVDPTRPVRPIR